MLQVRKLVLAVAAATSMASGVAHALGLGEISVKSALNEPLVAEIELLETRGLTAEEIRSQLASAADFSRSGVERPFFLTNLKFTPVVRADGKSFVRVTSNQAVREPFLNFLLEVYWKDGRVLKEYTLLLDPPMYSPQELVYTEAPAVAPASKPIAAPVRPAAPAVAPVAQRTPAPARVPAPRPAAQPALDGDLYQVQKNDTLWEIALRAGAGKGSVHQTMLAIQDLNPNAFIDGNINRLKNGQTLKLPSEEQVRKRNRGQAVSEFQAQVDSWRSGAVAERQLDARRRETAADAPARAEQRDNLRLVAAETGETAVASDSGSASRELRDQLALAKEQLDSTRSQNQDLSNRVDELSSQVEKLQRLLELKNSQLANLQNMDGQPAVSEQPVDAAADLEPVQEAPIASSDLGEVMESPVEPMASEAPAEPVAAEPAVVEPVAVEPVKTPEQPAAVQPPAPRPPVMPFDQPEPKSFIEEVLDNPLALPVAGGGAVLLILLALLARRKAKQRAEQQDDDLVLADEGDDNPFASAATGKDEDILAGDLDDLDALIDEPAVAAAPADDFIDADSTATSNDPIAEAENYTLYGRFSQAATVLLQAIDADPQRQDLRFKLLEVCADLGDRNVFAAQIDELVAMGAPADKLNEVRQRFSHMMVDDDLTSMVAAGDNDASDPLADAIPDLDDLLKDDMFAGMGADAPAADTNMDDEDFSKLLEAAEDDLVSISPLDKGIDYTPEPLPVVEEAPAADAAADNLADFELPGLEDLEMEALQPDALTSDELSLGELDDLGDLNLEPVAAESALPSADLDLDLDLELGLGDTDALELPEARTAATDFDLDADLDLSLPVEPAVAEQADSALDTGKLEVDLASLEDSFDALNADMNASLGGGANELDAIADGFSLDDLDNLDAGLDLSMPDLELPNDSPLADTASDPVLSELEQSLDDDFSFLQGDDEDTTKLDLAAAWIEMGDVEGAREILDEVMREGAPEHQDRVRELMAKLV